MTIALAMLVSVIVSVAVSYALVPRRSRSEIERERQVWERERKDLLDRVMYMADKPWSLPQAEPEVEAPDWDRPVLIWPEVEPDE